MAVFSTLNTPRFFCGCFSKFLGVPPFFDKKSEKNLQFFSRKFLFFLKKKTKFFWIFSSKLNFQFFWQKSGGSPNFFDKNLKKIGGTQRWKNGNPRGALGTSKVEKRAILEAHLVRREPPPPNPHWLNTPSQIKKKGSYARSKKKCLYNMYIYKFKLSTWTLLI